MASEKLKDLGEFRHFYGNDPKGQILVQATYEDDAYDRPTNNRHQVCMREQLLKAENYNNISNIKSSTDGQSMAPGDVHFSLPDLIITTAMLHHLVDQPVGVVSNLGDALDIIEKGLNDYFTQNNMNRYLEALASVAVAGKNLNDVVNDLNGCFENKFIMDLHYHCRF